MKGPLFRAALKDSRTSTIIYCAVLVLYGMLIMSAFTSVGDTFSDPFTKNNDVEITEIGENDSGSPVYNLSWETEAQVDIHVAVGIDTAHIPRDLITDMMTGDIPDPASMNLTWGNISELIEMIPELGEGLGDQGLETPVEPAMIDENGTSMVYMGPKTFVRFVNVNDNDLFFVLLVPENGNLNNATIKGPVSMDRLDVVSSFDNYLEDNAFVEGFIGDIDIDFSSIEGYLSLEYFSMWPLLFIIFLAVKTAGTISKHVEDRSMDILLATGYSRVRFMNEKVLLIALNLFLVVISAWMGLLLGIFLIGEPIPLAELTLTFMVSLPMALAVLGISLLISVLIDEGGKAIGIVMGVVMGEYIISIVANLSDWGDTIKYLSIFTYWDSHAAMGEMSVDPVNIIVPMSIAVISFALSYYIFVKKEIHA